MLPWPCMLDGCAAPLAQAMPVCAEHLQPVRVDMVSHLRRETERGRSGVQAWDRLLVEARKLQRLFQ